MPSARLPTQAKPIAYRATVRVDPAQPEFRGAVEIDVRVPDAARGIWLHASQLDIDQASAVMGRETVALAPLVQGADTVLLLATRPLVGEVTLKLSYRGRQDEKGSAGLFRQKEGDEWYSFTQFEPNFARRVFPSIDEPDRKTQWTVTLEVPAGLIALSNTRPVRETPLADGWKRVRFATTLPLPPYLVAFAVGPFELADAGKSRTGSPIRVAAFKGRLAHTKLAVEVFPRALALLEDYLDHPYPYDKLDLVAVPVSFGFAAMEHPGLVTCVQDWMLFDPARSTPGDRRAIALISAHELAHQWFGNLVTPAWWDDIWLAEGLASWIETRIALALDPRPDDVFEPADTRREGLAMEGPRYVRKPILSATDMDGVLHGVAYGKAASVVAMFERWIGADAFQRAIRAYVKKHAHGVVTTSDFLSSMSEAGAPGVWGMSTFLDQAGAPRLRVALQCGEEPDPRPTLSIQQSSTLLGVASRTGAWTPWRFPLCVAHDRGGTRGETCTVVEAASTQLALETRSCPTWVLPNVGGVGHYRLGMTRNMVDRAIRDGWSHMTPVERVVLAGEVQWMIAKGDVELELGLLLVPRLVRENNRAALERAVALAEIGQAVPEPRMAVYQAWLLRMFGAPARQLGWLPTSGEPRDFPLRRATVVPFVASAGDRALQEQAILLAGKWPDLPRDARRGVLSAAIAADATGETFDRVLTDALGESDRATRADLYAALAATRDPAKVAKVLQLLVHPKVDLREVAELPGLFWREPERTQVETFVRQHLADLLERHPREGASGRTAPFTTVFASACDAQRRAELARSLSASVGKLPGGNRFVKQTLAQLNACSDWKRRIGPQVERWLATQGATR